MLSIFSWSFLTILGILFAIAYGYIYYQDRDKRKLMFTLAFAFASFGYLLEIQPSWEGIQALERFFTWSVLPMMCAVSIAVFSSLLKLEHFDKPFKFFLLTLAGSIFLMIIPLPVDSLHVLLFPSMSVIVIAISTYLSLARREISDFIFLLAMVCFTSGGLGMGFNLGVPFIVFSYTFAYVLMGLVFMTSKESATGSIASFFSLRKEFEKTQKELEISQQQLEKSEYKFKSLVDLIADPVVIVDHKGHFLEINDKIVELTGFSEEELIGKNFLKTDIVTKKSKAILIKNLAKRMIGINVKPYEIEANTKSGETLHVEVNAKKIEYEGKSADLVVFHDITERKMMEEKREKYAEQLEEDVKERTKILRENEEKLRSIFDSSPDAIAVSDLKGNIVECNQATLNLLELSTKDEIIGKNNLIFVAKKDRKKVIKTMKNVLDTGSVKNVEYAALDKADHEFPSEFSASAIKDPSGNPIGFVTIIEDITERKKMENDLRNYSEHLEELVEQRTRALKESQELLVKTERLTAIGQAATMVGHDLRNPLQAIENGIFFLNTELSNLPVSYKTTETLQAIHSSIEYADNIVRDLQIFASKREPVFRETDINATVKETFSQVKTPENVKTIIETDQLPKIEVDKEMIKHIFVNLAVNGIQAMEEKGGTLKISTKKTKGAIEVSFKDTGIGIKKENLRKIFTPFFTTKAQGMGVGLTISKRFAELHDGNIKVESKEGEGSVFTVKLPIQRNGGVKLD